MRNPDSPFLELGFYFTDLGGRDAFERLVRTMLHKFGAEPKEAVVASVASHSDWTSEDIFEFTRDIERVDELWQLFSNPETFVKRVTIEHGTRVVPDASEWAVILPVREPFAAKDRNCVSLWIEGESMSAPDDGQDSSAKSRNIGHNTLNAFRELVVCMRPAYGAITIDYPLETPFELLADPFSYAFRDFYLDRDVFGDISLRNIRTDFPNAQHLDCANGQLTITTSVFSDTPMSSALSASEALRLSGYVAKIVASLC